ncbi:hypothetical protein [Aliarcobacter cryaerophilus]|nr:hypothetical protein [Aliarcobacter cryaerophilus]
MCGITGAINFKNIKEKLIKLSRMNFLLNKDLTDDDYLKLGDYINE